MPDASGPLGRPLLVVSPHLDDAMLSCSAVLLGERPAPVDVLTVLAGEPADGRASAWDRVCGFSSAAEALAARLEEDERAFSGLAATVTRLRITDGAYGDRPLDAVEQWTTWCTAWTGRHRSCTVLVPAGAGRLDPGRVAPTGREQGRSVPGRSRRLRDTGVGLAARRLKHHLMLARRRRAARTGMLANGDHALVRDSLVAALSHRPTVAVVLYEELPYLWSRPADASAAAVARRTGCDAVPLSLPVDRRAKAARLAAYASQLPHLDPDHRRLESADALPTEERAWWLRPRR